MLLSRSWGEFILDVIFHVFIMISMTVGMIAWAKLRKVTDEEIADAVSLAEGTAPGPQIK